MIGENSRVEGTKSPSDDCANSRTLLFDNVRNSILEEKTFRDKFIIDLAKKWKKKKLNLDKNNKLLSLHC